MDSESVKNNSIDNNSEVTNSDNSEVTNSDNPEVTNSDNSEVKNSVNSEVTNFENAEVTNSDSLNPTKDDNEASKLPGPRPSTKRKKDIITDVSNFKQIDEHVMRTPEDAEKSVEALGHYLSRHHTNVSSDMYENQCTRL